VAPEKWDFTMLKTPQISHFDRRQPSLFFGMFAHRGLEPQLRAATMVDAESNSATVKQRRTPMVFVLYQGTSVTARPFRNNSFDLRSHLFSKRHPAMFRANQVVAAPLLCILIIASRSWADPHTAANDLLIESGVRGGVIVHLGCGDGRLTAALRASDAYLVQGFDTDAENVAAARKYVQSKGLYGPVSVDRWEGRQLPFVDNFVNLVVAEDLNTTTIKEISRVLCPHGVAMIQRDGRWEKVVKPQPDEFDEWTHYLYDASNNAVSNDTAVGPLRHLQWIGGPRYSRHHDHMSNASAMVTSGGRLFSIFDYASPLSIQIASDYQLVARDAYNGKVLWRREIPDWHTQMFRLKSGPAQLTRRLVAVDDRVWITLGLEAPVTCLDAATGKTDITYAGTEKTEEIIHSDGVLFLLVNDNPYRQPKTPSELNYDYVEGKRRIVALDADSGKVLWDKPQENVLPITLTADEQRVLFCGNERVVCLDRKSGEPLWRTEPVQRRKSIPTFFGLTLVAYNDVALFSGGSVERDMKNATGGDNMMFAFDMETGKTLWTHDHPASGYKSAEDILVAGGLVWITENSFGQQSGVCIGIDPKTGEKRKEFYPDVETHWFHHRCYRAKATNEYLLFSRTGIEFVDPDKEHWECHHWVRGACLYGVMPANGMVYNPPHPCACYLEAKMYGFNALASASPTRTITKDMIGERLEEGPAYGLDGPRGNGGGRKTIAVAHRDWPTFRGDASRSGFTPKSVPTEVSRDWETNLGGKLTPPVVAGGRIFVASVDTHAVHALNEATGEPLWNFTAGARVDSPPTVYRGRVLFGSADGCVYCLRAGDGELCWRFRAAPVDRRHFAFGQVESVWPVHGSVLIRRASMTDTGEDELWCVAGRSMYVDGGLRLLRLEPLTGELIAEKLLDDRDTDSDENMQVRLKGLNMPVALNDVLSADNDFVYMRSQRFDSQGNRREVETPNLDVSQQRGEGPHLFSPTGFLDDVWWHRSYWLFGRVWKSGAGGYYQAGRVAPAGRPLVFNDTTVFGYGRKPQYYRWTTAMEYQLFATAKQPELVSTRPKQPPRKNQAANPSKKKRGGVGQAPAKRVAFDWTRDVPVLVRAMVLANDTLFFAGPADVIDEAQTLSTFKSPDTQDLIARQADVFAGAEGASLWAVSAADGEKLSELKLASVPVFDGLVAAGGRLIMTTTDGKVLCLGGK
jgi:outer membrane protein assembly factor BamB